ncbi:MAG TPA: MFS transporter [Rhodocyclaceae bacterium]
MTATDGRRAAPAALAWAIWGLAALFYLVAFYQRVAPAVITDQLMADFAIGGAALGNLSAFYFYSYVAMQVPTGIIADRWGPRRLLTAGAAVAALGTALFAVAPDIGWAGAGRLLVGASVAVGFVSLLKLASHWFPPQRYAFASGLLLLTGLVGGVAGGVPLRIAVDAFGWRAVMAASAVATAAVGAAIWLWVRDDPTERGYAGHFHAAAGTERLPVLRGLAQVLSYPNIWLLTLVPLGFAGAMLTFGGLWGVPWLRQVHGLDAKSASAITSMMLVSWGIGGPLLGSWSERLGRRKPLYVATGAVALAGWAAIAFLPLPLWAVIAILVPLGFASGNMIVGFAWVKESVPLRLTGTAAGIANMGPLSGGMLLQPGVGWLLDRHWAGQQAGGARLYDAAAWQAGFTLLFGVCCLSMLLILFARDSRCRQTA